MTTRATTPAQLHQLIERGDDMTPVMRTISRIMMGAVRENLWFGKMLIGGFTLHPLVLIFAVSGSLMISRIRIPKL
mgnify:CR=1 FL=1